MYQGGGEAERERERKKSKKNTQLLNNPISKSALVEWGAEGLYLNIPDTKYVDLQNR